MISSYNKIGGYKKDLQQKIKRKIFTLNIANLDLASHSTLGM